MGETQILVCGTFNRSVTQYFFCRLNYTLRKLSIPQEKSTEVGSLQLLLIDFQEIQLLRNFQI